MLPSSPAAPPLLDQLDALVTASCVQPEQCDLPPLLTLLLQALEPLPLAQQLDIAGYVFDQLAGVVDARATLLLAAWESWHGTQSPVVDLSGDSELFVQSQQLDVADLFAGGVRAPYPERQASGVRGSALADQLLSESEGLGLEGLGLGLGLGDGALSGTEGAISDGTLEGEGAGLQADCGFNPGLEGAPLTETELRESLKALSHGEDIPLWSQQVAEAMRSLVCAEHVSLTQTQRRQVKSMPLLSLQQSLSMPLVEVWLALLLGESGYQLTRAGGFDVSAQPNGEEVEDFHAWAESFYSGAALQVSAVE